MFPEYLFLLTNVDIMYNYCTLFIKYWCLNELTIDIVSLCRCALVICALKNNRIHSAILKMNYFTLTLTINFYLLIFIKNFLKTATQI